MKSLKKWQKFLLAGLLLILIILAGGITYLKVNAYLPGDKAETISQKAQEESDYLLFSAPTKSSVNLIFYPGAMVEPASYSIWAKEVAASGVNVYLVKMPLNMAFFGEKKAQKIISNAPAETYLLAGHSLGGVMASRFAKEELKEISGIIYLASYPDEKGDLSQSALPVLSITASKDGLVEEEDIRKTKKYLPKNTTYQVIEGGNHAGFGSYGSQKKDGQATISNQQQQTIISQLMIDWLEKNDF